jgi:hypothetical protein
MMDLDELDQLANQAASYENAGESFRVKTDPNLSIEEPAAPPAPVVAAAAVANRIKAGKPSRATLILLGVLLVVVAAAGGSFMVLNTTAEHYVPEGTLTPLPVIPKAGGEEPVNPMWATPPAPKELRGLRGDDGTRIEAAAPVVNSAKPEQSPLEYDGPPEGMPPLNPVEFRGKWGKGRGYMTVSTNPPGAIVVLDGINIENSPITFENIPAGEHQLILRHEDVGIQNVRTITIRPGQHWKGTWSFEKKRWVDIDK